MRQMFFGQNGFTIFQDTELSADTRVVAFLLSLFLGMDYAANAFQPTMEVLHSRSSTN